MDKADEGDISFGKLLNKIKNNEKLEKEQCFTVLGD